MKIQTAHLYLKPLSQADAVAMHSYAQNPDNVLYLSWQAHTNLAETQAKIEMLTHSCQVDGNVICAIHHSVEGMIGTIGLHFTGNPTKAELGYVIAEPHWGKGYATEASKALVKYAWANLSELTTIFARCFYAHEASANVLRKSGFVEVQGQKLDFLFPNLDAEKRFPVRLFTSSREIFRKDSQSLS